jgi:DNA-binding LytR/AlgR family response regulator
LDFRPFHFIPKSSVDVLTDRLKYVISKLEMQLIDSKSICFNLPYDEKKYLYPKDIVSIRSKANYYIINTKKKGEIQIRGKIDSAMAVLPERLFARVHNRYIVNMSCIKKVDYPNLSLIMSDNDNIDISRSFKKDFMEKYNNYLRNYS